MATDLAQFQHLLQAEGTRGALGYLNGRTPHRFTGIFRFDGDMLRSVQLIDKWDASVEQGDDLPVATAYCAHLKRTGESLQVGDGRSDPRVPWMNDSPIVSYCGTPIVDEHGEPWGALCHFDLQPCQAKDSDMPLLQAAGKLFSAALRQEP
ncbi:MAG: GAF domain-containing protein [Ramlibacter sp.]